MTEQRWQEIKTHVNNTFGLEDEYEEELDPGLAQVIEFVGPKGKMKARFVTRPKLLDKKTSYSNRAGSNVKVEYIFSEDEFVNFFEVFTWNEQLNNWAKIESEALF